MIRQKEQEDQEEKQEKIEEGNGMTALRFQTGEGTSDIPVLTSGDRVTKRGY